MSGVSMSGRRFGQEGCADRVDVAKRRAADEIEIHRRIAKALQEQNEVGDVERRNDSLLDERRIVVKLLGANLSARGDDPLTKLGPCRLNIAHANTHDRGSSAKMP